MKIWSKKDRCVIFQEDKNLCLHQHPNKSFFKETEENGDIIVSREYDFCEEDGNEGVDWESYLIGENDYIILSEPIKPLELDEILKDFGNDIPKNIIIDKIVPSILLTIPDVSGAQKDLIIDMVDDFEGYRFHRDKRPGITNNL